jgi:hypothetical protein
MTDNKLIAEFLGGKLSSDEYRVSMPVFDNETRLHNVKGTPKTSDKNIYVSRYVADLKYHKDWSELMAVVEKIENLGYEVIIAESKCKIRANTDHYNEVISNIDLTGSKLDATYKAVVEFVKLNT